MSLTETFPTAAPAANAPRAVSMPIEFLASLRQSVLTANAGSAGISVDAVRDAGYQAGQALFDQFASWLESQGEPSPTELADSRFPMLCEAFFHAHGWGRVEVTAISDAVVMLDAFEWSEASDADGGCLISTGLFAGFLGRLAGAPLSVLEVDPGTTAAGRCRFLVGSVDVLGYIWEAMQRGIPYERAAHSA